jgi:hypothetical protein
MKILKNLAFLALFAAVLLTGCQFAGLSNSEAVQVSTAKYALMQSSVIESEINVVSALSKATLPDSAGSMAIPGTIVISNYPESGQSTTFAITSAATANVYQVVATTTYTSSSIRDSTVESYYIYSADTTFDDTTTDYICDAAGTAAPKARIGFQTTIWYAKSKGSAETKSTRSETIEATTAVGGGLATGYAAFPIGGSLAYTDSYTPTNDAGARWSSEVRYTQTIPARQMGLDSVLGTPYASTYDLVGTRYYTETPNGSDWTCSSVSYEKTTTPSGAAVCESVVRTTYDIVGGVPGYKTVVSRSVIHRKDGSSYTIDLDDELYSSL